MLVLGLETSCDETGVALYDSVKGLLSHVVHSQIVLHQEYGGVVPELASRDHIRYLLPLIHEVLRHANLTTRHLDAVAYTAGPGLAGALLVAAGFAESFAFGLQIPACSIHHLEGHLLSPLLSEDPPCFPFVSLLVSGGHTQLMRVDGVGRYVLLGETLDDAAGEAFDKTAKLMGLGYPGGPQLAKLAERGGAGRFKLPRPMLRSGDLDFSFSGLKTAVLTLYRQASLSDDDCAFLAWEVQAAIVEVLVTKSLAALKQTGLKRLVVAGGVGANRHLREMLNERAAKAGMRVYYPELEYCTDNGAMIAFAGAMRLKALSPSPDQGSFSGRGFCVKPRWDLQTLLPAD